MSSTRLSEYLDHQALVAKLADTSEQCYKLLQLCNDLEKNLNDHNTDPEAHLDIRKAIEVVSGRLDTANTAFNTHISNIKNTYDAEVAELKKKDTDLENNLGKVSDKLDTIEKGEHVYDNSIKSEVVADDILAAAKGDVIIQSTTDKDGVVMLASLESPSGIYTLGSNHDEFEVNFHSDSDLAKNSPAATQSVVLLDKNGNSKFGKNVSAEQFTGKLVGDVTGNAATASNASKFNGLVASDFARTTGSVNQTITGTKTFKSPIVGNLQGTADNANKLDNLDSSDFVRKTNNVAETITGNKTFSATVYGDSFQPKSGNKTGTIGTNSNGYKTIYVEHVEASTIIGDVTGNLTGNADTATKLRTPRKINDTDFDGTSAITTQIWGTTRNFYIADSTGKHTGIPIGVNGSGTVTLRLPPKIDAETTGNANTATKLATARKINGTNFDGTHDITTAYWGTGRNVYISDSDGTHVSAAVTMDGSGNVTLKLPGVIKADLIGNVRGTVNGNLNGNVTGNADTASDASRFNGLVTTDFIRTTGNVNQTITGTKTFKSPIVGNLQGTAGNANKLDNLDSSDFVRKTNNVAETITGNKTFSATVYGDSFQPKSGNKTGTIGTSDNGYKTIYVEHVEASTIAGNVTGNLTGNAGSATKLATARTINGTAFNGTANITTANWGTARNISITDGTNTSTAVSVNGGANVSLKLPATIKATFVGNITGNVTGNCSGSSGSCTGNAATATRATQDAAGNTITTTYATKAENNTKANNSAVVHKSGDETIAGTKTFSNGVLSTAVNAFMAQNKGYTVLLRNDGSNTYLLISDKDGVPGTWSSARPFVISNSTGVCDINGNAASANIATKATQDSDGNKITTTYSKNGHTHDDRYYTENEVNNLLNGKANTSGTYSNLTVGNAGSATNATYANWLRTSSHSDHLFHTEWDKAGYFWTYVTTGNGDYRAVRVARSDSAATAQACTGNAATATKLAAARSLWGNNFDGSAAISGTITGTPSIEFKPTATTSNNGGFLDFHYNQSTADYTSRIIESASGTLSINNVTITTGKVVTATTFNGALKGNVTGNCSGSSGSCTGNAATATKLAAKRTIALSGAATGTATGFDGSGSITIPVTALDASKLTGTASASLVSDLLNHVYPVGSIYMSTVNVSPASFFGGTWQAIEQGRMLMAAGSSWQAGTTGGAAYHTLTVAEMPAHDHSATETAAGGHTHEASTDSAGAHSHSGSTNSAGNHHHTGTTSTSGAHHHGTWGENTGEGDETPFGLYDDTNNHWGKERGGLDKDNALFNTSTDGNHSHSFSTSWAGEHAHSLSINSAGAHTHSVAIAAAGAHTHAITIGKTGSGAAFSILPPYIAVYMWRRTA